MNPDEDGNRVIDAEVPRAKISDYAITLVLCRRTGSSFSYRLLSGMRTRLRRAGEGHFGEQVARRCRRRIIVSKGDAASPFALAFGSLSPVSSVFFRGACPRKNNLVKPLRALGSFGKAICLPATNNGSKGMRCIPFTRCNAHAMHPHRVFLACSGRRRIVF